MPGEPTSLISDLRREILRARQRVYEVGQATPLDEIRLSEEGIDLFVKREDLSTIHAYKWRGAYNRMAQLTAEELQRGVVTASAGNHAQGVALAAKHLGTQATIYMPLSTPKMKQQAVRQHGESNVTICLVGDTYDAASEAAHACAKTENKTYIHAYDDLAVMAGQGTLAEEIVLAGKPAFDVALLQVGGGGMAAATATWLKMHQPDIKIIGVEGVDQASMAAAIKAGKPVTLEKVDVFCDGTAVRTVGNLTYQVCAEVIDEWVTVTNDEVSAAIQFLWEKLRTIPEPSGAMGVAALLKDTSRFSGMRVLTVLCGSNMDFELLASIARRSAIGAATRRYLRIQIPETSGSMYKLLDFLPVGVNIADFQYGKTDANQASPVIGFDVSVEQFSLLSDALHQHQYSFTEVTSETDVEFRLIHYESKLIKFPYFMELEFHERPGALAEFLRAVSPHTNLCYFNYVYSGERVGRALLGFEFDNETYRNKFEGVLHSAKQSFRDYEKVSEATMKRILG